MKGIRLQHGAVGALVGQLWGSCAQLHVCKVCIQPCTPKPLSAPSVLHGAQGGVGGGFQGDRLCGAHELAIA